MTETQNTRSWISAFPDLGGIVDEAWLEAAMAAREADVPAGAAICRPGDPCTDFVLLAQGAIRVFEAGAGGRELVLFRVQPGEMCIMTASHLLQQRPYSAVAMTEGEARLIVIPGRHFQNALTRSDAFRSYVMTTLARRLGDVMDVVGQVAFRRLDLRLACLLGRRFGEQNSPQLQVTHEELARELGTTREVMSRMLKEFERLGCIRLYRGAIECLSLENLKKIEKETAA